MGRVRWLAALLASLLAAGAGLLVAVVPAHAAMGVGLVLRLDSLAPRIVTVDAAPTLSITGSVSNTGDRWLHGLELRVQRGPALLTDRDMAAALAGTAPADAVTPAFSDLAEMLAPGQTQPFALSIPLRGPDPASLSITQPGTYPLLVNVNGVPDFGGRARLAAVRLLLPVLGLPPPAGSPPVADTAPPMRTTPPATPPVRIGLLYPLVDVPRRLPTGPREPALLTDDELATSLAPGGRLSGLLSALASAAPPGSPLAAATCLVVDPDLVQTAAAMAAGYRVRTPTGVIDGRGALAAAQWLDTLKATAQGRCLLSLPYADADLVAMSRADLADLADYATVDGARVTAAELGVTPLPGTSWPPGGRIDDRTLADISAGGGRAVVLSPGSLAGGGLPAGGVTRLAGSDVTALVTDPLVSTALGGDLAEEHTGLPGGGSPDGSASDSPDGSVSDTPAGTAAPLATQDGLGALVYRATVGSSGSSSGSVTSPVSSPRVVLAAPPRRWQVDAAEAGALLTGVAQVMRAGLAVPADIAGLADGAAGPTTALSYPLAAGAEELPVGVTSAARKARDEQRDLFTASEQDRVGSLPPAALFEPVEADLLRGLSAAWRPRPAAAAAAVAAAASRIDTLRSMVDVVQPPGPYSLGSDDAPLLISVENQLPVAVDVRLTLSPTPGLRTHPVPLLRVPAQGRIQVRVTATVSRSGQFSVEARATTPSGGALGPASRLLLRSTAYGTITVWLTGSAGAVLVLLAGLRIARRMREPPGGAHRRPSGDGPGGGRAKPGTAAPAATAPSGTR